MRTGRLRTGRYSADSLLRRLILNRYKSCGKACACFSSRRPRLCLDRAPDVGIVDHTSTVRGRFRERRPVMGNGKPVGFSGNMAVVAEATMMR